MAVERDQLSTENKTKGDDMNLIELEKKIKEHEVIQKFKDGVTDAMLHGTRDEKQSHHYYKQGYDFGIDLFCKQEEWTHE